MISHFDYDEFLIDNIGFHTHNIYLVRNKKTCTQLDRGNLKIKNFGIGIKHEVHKSKASRQIFHY
jgi:hypothetical protein